MAKKCDCCGRSAKEVQPSRTGAVREECLKDDREPYGAVLASLYGMNVADWYKPTITATAKAENKTIDELFEDVQKATKEFDTS